MPEISPIDIYGLIVKHRLPFDNYATTTCRSVCYEFSNAESHPSRMDRHREEASRAFTSPSTSNPLAKGAR